MTDECVRSLQNFFASLVKDYIYPKLDSKYISLLQICEDKKKNVKKSFFGLFKKDEEPVFMDGRYIFTPVEEASKNFGDLLFQLGLFDLAEKEYKHIHGCVKVSSPY